MRRVLVPVDGSARGLMAVRDVAGTAAADIDLVHLLHVQPFLPLYVARWIPRARRDAWRAARARVALAPAEAILRHAGIPHAAHVVLGRPAPAIAQAARQLRVHEIVLGATRRGPWAAWLANSTSARLLEMAPVPVRVIPAQCRWIDCIAKPRRSRLFATGNARPSRNL